MGIGKAGMLCPEPPPDVGQPIADTFAAPFAPITVVTSDPAKAAEDLIAKLDGLLKKLERELPPAQPQQPSPWCRQAATEARIAADQPFLNQR